MIFEDLVDKGLQKLNTVAGITEGELFFEETTTWELELEKQIESLKNAKRIGIGARVVVDGRKVGFYSSTVNTPDDIEHIINIAYKIAKAQKEDPDWISLPKNIGQARVEGIFDKKLANVSIDDLMQLSHEYRDRISEFKDIYPSRSNIEIDRCKVGIVTTYGAELIKEETGLVAWLRMVAKKGAKKASGDEYWISRRWDAPIEWLIGEAARKAVLALKAKKIQSAKMKVIWKNSFATEVLNTMLSRTISAESVQKGRSPLAGKIGEKIASDIFTIIDEGLRKWGIGTSPFDDEGVPQQNMVIFEKGVLKNFVYDSYTAHKEEKESTGNAARGYTSIPHPAPHNLVLKRGRYKLETLISNVEKGILIEDAIGTWLSNPISGEINATITHGQLIENGELTKSVKGVIIRGNWFDIIKNGIEIIGNDVRAGINVYSPSILISEMTIAGK
ncbi:MAG: TldD/PmbA family protein [Candidatus Asgardarchaeia archaeon]